MFGPVLLVKIKGAICPCLESEPDKYLREGIGNLTNLPIRFYPQASSSNDGGGVGGFVSGLFGKGAASNISKVISGGKNAKLSVIDTIKGPSIYIESDLDADNGVDNANDNNVTDQQKAETKTIPLKRIGVVAADDAFLSTSCAGIIMYEKGRSFSDDGDGGSDIELLRFDLQPAANSNEGIDSETRDQIVDKILMIVQWEGRRKEGKSQDNSCDEESEEGVSAVKKKNVASKLKHFAQREIEMKKQKRDREKKKSRYMKESGGLKYTAVAMANREMT